MHLVEVPEGVGQLGQHDGAVAAVHAADIIAFQRVHEALCHAVRLRAFTGVCIGLMPSCCAKACVSIAQKAPPLSLKNSSVIDRSSVLPKRASTASIIMSRTGSPSKQVGEPGNRRWHVDRLPDVGGGQRVRRRRR